MEDLTPNEVARLHLKARHGTLTPEEQQYTAITWRGRLLLLSRPRRRAAEAR